MHRMVRWKRSREFRASRLLQRIRVPVGFLAAGLFMALSRPTGASLGAGLPLAIAGVALRAWASGHLRKNVELAVTGPYAYTRNPLYLGSMIVVAGCAVCGDRWPAGLALMGLFAAVYLPVMRAEAAHMRQLFDGEYERWAAHVPLLIPRARPWASGLTRRFDSAQYLRHREYRAAAGLAVVVGILSLKAAGMLDL